MEVVRKRIVSGRCCNICRRYLQMFSVTAVLGEKASVRVPSFLDVAQHHSGQEEDQ